jgi:hypothetical protein
LSEKIRHAVSFFFLLLLPGSALTTHPTRKPHTKSIARTETLIARQGIRRHPLTRPSACSRKPTPSPARPPAAPPELPGHSASPARAPDAPRRCGAAFSRESRLDAGGTAATGRNRGPCVLYSCAVSVCVSARLTSAPPVPHYRTQAKPGHRQPGARSAHPRAPEPPRPRGAARLDGFEPVAVTVRSEPAGVTSLGR